MFDLWIYELYALPCYDGPYCNETRMHIDRYLCKLLSGDTWQINAFFSECPSPPIPQNSTLTFSQRGPLIAGVAVIYACKPGYQYKDGGQSRSFVCKKYNGNRIWHMDITDCTSKCHHLSLNCLKYVIKRTISILFSSKLVNVSLDLLNRREWYSKAWAIFHSATYSFPCLSVKTCPPLKPVHARPSYPETQGGGEATFICDEGTRFIDGRQQFSVTCGLGGKWSTHESLIDCKGSKMRGVSCLCRRLKYIQLSLIGYNRVE